SERRRALLDMLPRALGPGLGCSARFPDPFVRGLGALDDSVAYALGGLLDSFACCLGAALDLTRGIVELRLIRRDRRHGDRRRVHQAKDGSRLETFHTILLPLHIVGTSWQPLDIGPGSPESPPLLFDINRCCSISTPASQTAWCRSISPPESRHLHGEVRSRL